MNLLSLLAAISLKIAVFDVDATPPVGSELAYQKMEASSDLSLRARGIVLLGAEDPIVLCAVDWIGIANEGQDAFKQALARAAGTSPDRVAVHTIHQHDVPICDFTAESILLEKGMPPAQFDGHFARRVIRRLEEAVSASLKRARPVSDIGIGKAKVHKVASNRTVRLKDGTWDTRFSSEPKRKEYRRMPQGVVDPEVSLVSFWDGDTPVAVLSFYATHPQSYYLTRVANPDFPGIARTMRALKVPDVLHVHFNGAGGNIAAGKYNDGSHRMRLVLAQRLEQAMQKAWRHTSRCAVASVSWVTEPLLLPANPKVATLEDSLAFLNRNHLTNNVGKLGWYRRRQQGLSIDAACLGINGDIRLLFMPGELFVEYQLAAKQMAPDKFVAMAAYGDYGPFYIGTRQAYRIGGYEIESSPVTEEVEDYILEHLRILLDKSN